MDKMSLDKKYTITEAAKISGLPESTLRYYETIGIIRPIERDSQTKRRVYSEDDINLVIAIACLSATGLSIDDMRAYLKNREDGQSGALAQVEILNSQLAHLVDELHYAELRIKYVEAKVAFWKAVAGQNKQAVEEASKTAYAIADKMKLPRATRRK
jgi:MerR family transcriptional regulator, aldehyde-responsive regulator